MKKLILFAFVSLFTLVSFAQGYVIDGQVKGSKNGLATLRTYFRDGNEQLDSSKIEEDGKFYFRGQIKDPIPALLTINGKKTYRLYLSPGDNVEIVLVPQNEKKTKIKGSKLTDKWYSIVAPQKKEDYDVHLSRLENWVINNPKDIFSPDIIASYLAYKWNYSDLHRTLNTLKEEALNTYHYKHLRERENLMTQLKIGAKTPNFTSKTAQNKTFRLTDEVKKHDYTLLYFWASWSKKSREENPELVRIYNKYNRKGFDIVGVSLDEDKDLWQRAIQEDKLSWTQLCDFKKWETSSAQTYMIKEVPSNVLIDRDGKIVAFNLSTEELAMQLKELTAESGFTISGTIAGIEEGKISLELLLANGKKELIKSKVVNGFFEFSGKVERTCMAIVSLPSNIGEISFFMDNENIEITGKADNLEKIVIKGSSSNDEFLQIANRCNRQKNPMQCLMNYVNENKSSVYSPFIVTSYLAPYLKTSELREIYSTLEGEAKNMYQYDLLGKHILELDKEEQVGEKIRNFTLENTKSEPVSLMDIAQKNKYTLIHFWASWDNKSLMQIKDLRQLYKRFKKDGLEIVSVSLDDSKTAWKNTISVEKMNWVNLSDLKRWSSVIVKLFDLTYIPQNILIDSKGNIIAKNLNVDEISERLLLMFAR
ncbi:MAG: thioredoxin-like domain-containing protein [Bacteroidales bacterium]|nr:thioredoxin-like domain-containing protein [Bacteroidales bacterium]